MSDFVEGRDYFYLPQDILQYLLKFGNNYDPVGISLKTKSQSKVIRTKAIMTGSPPSPMSTPPSAAKSTSSACGSKRKLDAEDKLSDESSVSELEVAISDKRLAKQTKASTVMHRPHGDYLFRGHKNPDIRVNCKYDILDENKYFFICRIEEMSGHTATIHFPHWPRKFDIKVDVRNYYFAPFGDYSIPAGIDLATNRYTLRLYFILEYNLRPVCISNPSDTMKDRRKVLMHKRN